MDYTDWSWFQQGRCHWWSLSRQSLVESTCFILTVLWIILWSCGRWNFFPEWSCFRLSKSGKFLWSCHRELFSSSSSISDILFTPSSSVFMFEVLNRWKNQILTKTEFDQILQPHLFFSLLLDLTPLNKSLRNKLKRICCFSKKLL